MVAISNRMPSPVTIEYDCRNRRVRKVFDDAYEAKRWYCAKHKSGHNPRVVGNETPPTTKIVACYVRVSTVGQNEAGQRAEVQRWLDGNGIDPDSVRWFVDQSTGDNLNRPEFERLQAAIFAGEIATVVCFKLDRLSRSLRDGINTLGGWCEKGIRVVATSQQLDFNANPTSTVVDVSA